jgi:hypothetical protein
LSFRLKIKIKIKIASMKWSAVNVSTVAVLAAGILVFRADLVGADCRDVFRQNKF